MQLDTDFYHKNFEEINITGFIIRVISTFVCYFLFNYMVNFEYIHLAFDHDLSCPKMLTQLAEKEDRVKSAEYTAISYMLSKIITNWHLPHLYVLL